MWTCHKCGKEVFFAERKQSLGYDWHPECLRCEECGKRLNPGLHAEHKGVPYCNVPCYGALFGPHLFGHGTRVEAHKSFGNKNSPRQASALPRDHLESKLKVYNQFFDKKSHVIRSREVNDRLVFEGTLRVYWGVQAVIHLKEDDDQRTVITVRKRNSCRYVNSNDGDSDTNTGAEAYEKLLPDSNDTGLETSTSSIIDGDSTDISLTESMPYDRCSLTEDITSGGSLGSSKEVSPEHRSNTLPSKLKAKQADWDDLDELLQVERKTNSNEKLYQTLPTPLTSQSSIESSTETTSTLTEDLDFHSVSEFSSQQDDTTITDEFLTPQSTLKNVDYDKFKIQMQEEFINNSNELQQVNDDTLKMNQPIDPSRINDSLKLYSENVMSKSFAGEQCLRVCPTSKQYQTLTAGIDAMNISPRPYGLQKSESASTRQTFAQGTDYRMNFGINRSKSGPNWYDNNSDDNSETLKPSTIRKNKLNIKMDCYDELDNDLQKNSNGASTNAGETATSTKNREDESLNDDDEDRTDDGVVLRKPKTGSTAIKRRSGNKRSRAKVKRRCSINGHFYNRETSFFTPPFGSQMSVWVTSLVSTQDVISLLLEKYKVESRPENFALFVVRDNGEQRRLKNDEYPLVVRIMLGPHEDVARIFLTDSQSTSEISCEVAQFLNLSELECRSILDRYDTEMGREVAKIRNKYEDLRRRIIHRMESLKVRL